MADGGDRVREGDTFIVQCATKSLFGIAKSGARIKMGRKFEVASEPLIGARYGSEWELHGKRIQAAVPEAVLRMRAAREAAAGGATGTAAAGVDGGAGVDAADGAANGGATATATPGRM